VEVEESTGSVQAEFLKLSKNGQFPDESLNTVPHERVKPCNDCCLLLIDKERSKDKTYI
jgi:hypothetical protein